MNSQGAFTIIFDEHINKILLVKRKDFPVWDLPGGRVEKEESPADCACRESLEETGYIIETLKKIGEYYRPHLSDIQHTFVGKIAGGMEIINGDETSKLKWFKINRLPFLMVPHRKSQIKDFILGYHDLKKTIEDSKSLLKIMKAVKSLK